MHEIRETFRGNYSRALDAVLSITQSLTICTIYNPAFGQLDESSHLQAPAEAALSIFNDVITQEALWRGLPLIDLRMLCTESADFANPIEPSFRGGQKIARAIIDSLPNTMSATAKMPVAIGGA